MHILAGHRHDRGFTFFNTVCSRVFAGYIKGTLIGCLCVGVLSGLGFWIIGIPYAVVLGALTGIFTIVPYIGPIVAGVVVAVFALFNGIWPCILSVIVSLAAQWVVANLISPRIMSSTVNLHPCVILVAIIVGGALGGTLGMLVAIPITAIIKDLMVYGFERRTDRQLVTEDGALFKGKPSADVDPISDATDGFMTTKDLEDTVSGVGSAGGGSERHGVRRHVSEAAESIREYASRKVHSGAEDQCDAVDNRDIPSHGQNEPAKSGDHVESVHDQDEPTKSGEQTGSAHDRHDPAEGEVGKSDQA